MDSGKTRRKILKTLYFPRSIHVIISEKIFEMHCSKLTEYKSRSKQSLSYGGLVNISKLVLFESIHVKKLSLYAFSTAPLYMKVIIKAESHKFSRVSMVFCISAAYWLRSSICNRGLIMMRNLFVHKNKWTKKMGVQLELKFKMASENCPCSLFLSHWLFLFLFLAQSQCASITKEIS